ncbi:MAG TPA: hypothetical protein VIS95_07020 [Solirubrobacterales bacterium]
MRVLSRLAAVVRRPFAHVAWPFERVAWTIERTVLWPIGERFAGRRPPERGAGAAALAAIAAAAVLAGVLTLGGDSQEETGPVARVAIETAQPEARDEEPSGPVLQGVSPNFDVAGGAPPVPSDAAAELNAAGAIDAPASADANQVLSSEEGAAASSSAKKPVPAGPAAMKVARRFSEAFVFYEIGERPARAKVVFGETASPQLAEALVEREPRQPAEGEVPKARVLNLVPGPRAGKAYTVSVSLLRVGLTSELRLELSRKKGNWLVTDVRG